MALFLSERYNFAGENLNVANFLLQIVAHSCNIVLTETYILLIYDLGRSQTTLMSFLTPYFLYRQFLLYKLIKNRHI